MTTRKNNKRNRPGSGLFAFANLANTVARSLAGYAGAQERAALDRLKAENLALKNQIEAQRVGKLHNDVLLGDLTIEKRLLEIQVLRQKLGLAGQEFKATDYEDPGNIREEERNRKS